MPSRSFHGGRLRKAVYDVTSRQLDLHWEGGRVDAYRHVPAEVWRRLCSAPNPATYWEDRIAEEYPRGTPMPPGQGEGEAPAGGGPTLHDLFGDVAGNEGAGKEGSDGGEDAPPR